MSQQDYDRFKFFVVFSYWKESTSAKYKSAPHAYTLLEASPDPEEFLWAVQFIRDHGYGKNFWKKIFIYFDFEGYSYWTMGAPIEETILINRAVVAKL